MPSDEVITNTTTPVELTVTAPVVDAPSNAQTPVQADTPVEGTPTPATGETPASEAPEGSQTVLGEALEKTEQTPDPTSKEESPTSEEKAEETKEEGTEQPDEGGQSDEPAPPPKYDPFTLPEGITLDEARIGEFTGLLSELETSGKASHEAVQAFGQKAVEFHINEVKNAIENVTELYKQAWDKQKTNWKEAFLKDPVIGGNRFQTTVDSALNFIRTHGGTSEEQAEFRALMETSGLGNHPAMIRMLSNAGRAMQEGKPLAAPKPVPNQKSKTQTLYGKS